MPPPLLFNLDGIDLNRVVVDRNEVYEHLPHRHEFQLLSGICHMNAANAEAIGLVDVSLSDWWARGHVPGRPILPGVLMLEMAAQASAVLARICWDFQGFIAFGGVDACKFRDAVTRPLRLHLLVKGREHRARRIVCDTQGVADGRIIFEARITGMSMP